MLAKLAHPNVVTVYDAGTFGDEVFIAMELVEGTPLDRWLAAAPRSYREILEAFMAVGRGLAAAHAAGVVHRDVKPANLVVGNDGRVRVSTSGSRASARARISPPRARSSAPRPTWRPSNSRAARSGRRAISSASASRCSRRSTA